MKLWSDQKKIAERSYVNPKSSQKANESNIRKLSKKKCRFCKALNKAPSVEVSDGGGGLLKSSKNP